MPKTPKCFSLEWVNGLRPVIADIRTERRNQFLKWGFQAHDLPTWLVILNEELGELSEEILKAKFIPGPPRPQLRAEAVQVAAVAAAIVQYLDKGKA